MLRKTRNIIIWASVGFLLLVFVLVSLRVELNIDLEKTLYAVAAIIGVSFIGIALRHFLKPERTVRLVTSVVLESPPRILSSMKNHKLHIRSEKHIEQKGKHEIVKMDEVILSFNKKDHPDIQAYSTGLVNDFLERQEKSLSEEYPDSQLLISPFALEIKGRLDS